MRPTETDTREPSGIDSPFRSILCGVDGSRTAFEAARQAAILAGPGAQLTYIAVTGTTGIGATAQAQLGVRRAREALRRARMIAHEVGVDAGILEDHAADETARLLELAGAHDLIVAAIHGHSRAGGILLGTTGSALAHRAPVPVLLARRPPTTQPFLEHILLAADGTPPSLTAATVATAIARRHGSRIAMIASPDPADRHVVAECAATIRIGTDVEPVILDERGPAHRAAAAAAGEIGASLLVTGSRGLSGASALRSVSERIAHAAPCSVLIVRPRATEAGA